ncbi:hypothetical protein C8F04DRAFT_1202417 [Mycena alexandri]|uniref:Uncharacterized protein n=1 Tax=Mycena alexandri TaxID=1745969 RepID=A0AAD6WM63_9AGAR|nr:hypothetical protein C8F04DRAFT_1202417 [Mycena alexandri]
MTCAGCRASVPALSGAAGAALDPLVRHRHFLMARGYDVGRIRAAERERMAAPDTISGGRLRRELPLTPTSMPVFPTTATTAYALPHASPVRIPRRAHGTVWGVLDGARGEGRGQGRRNVVLTQRSRGALRNLVDAYPMCGFGVFVATDGTLYQGRCSRLYTRAPTSPLRNRTRGRLRGTARRAATMRATNLCCCCSESGWVWTASTQCTIQNAVHLPSAARLPPQPVCVLHTWAQAVALLGRRERAAAAVLAERREYLPPQRLREFPKRKCVRGWGGRKKTTREENTHKPINRLVLRQHLVKARDRRQEDDRVHYIKCTKRRQFEAAKGRQSYCEGAATRAARGVTGGGRGRHEGVTKGGNKSWGRQFLRDKGGNVTRGGVSVWARRC